MKKIFSLLAVILMLSFCLHAQEKPEELNNGHHIGAFVGGSSGYGLSYRYFKNKIGIQISTIPIFSSDNTHFSVGSELLLSINRTEKTNFYTYLGYHYNYQNGNDSYQVISPFSSEIYYDYDEEVSNASVAGLGVGFELIAGHRVSFNWQLGYGFAYLNVVDDPRWKTILDVGFGMYFKF